MRGRPTHKGIRHLALHVQSFEQMKQFYTEVLGFVVEWEPDADNIYLTSGTDNLALHRSISDATKDGSSSTALDHFGLVVSNPADVDSWADYLHAHNVLLDKAPKTHRDGARSCYFSDPDGNQIQIIYHAPISDRS
ncbi:MAG: VOC family protein [Acidobacteriota bacterium]|nr:VOC family protein [Acidobacteriota bacterium]